MSTRDQLLLAALILAACLGACSGRKSVRFPHVTHITGIECGEPGGPECLSCGDCHESSDSKDIQKLPQQSLCVSCHQKNERQALRVYEAKVSRPYGKIGFNHDKHLAMKSIGGQCVQCHTGVVKEGSAALPPMSQCFSCHQHEQQWQEGQCMPCHEQRDLRQIMPETFLRHDRTFLRHHGSEATTQEKLCKSCHTQSDCQSCHDLTQALTMERRRPNTIETNQVHRGDFLARHAIEARSRPDRCMSCHEPPDCDSCHIQRGVSGNLAMGRSPHPRGWMGANPSAPDFHGRAARRDILECAGCHEAGPATNCITCHKVGAYGGNPHPNGWRSLREPSDTMCRYCHEGM